MGLSVDGLASGLDTANIISDLISLEKIPVTRKENDQVEYTEKLSIWSELESKLSNLKSITDSMSTKAKFGGVNASFINDDATATQTVVTAAATSSVSSGTYSLEVLSIASVEKEVSQGFLDKDTAVAYSGSINITVGTTTTSINIDSSSNSLTGIKNAINSSNAGVTASIINDGSSTPYRLIISGNSSGASNTISITDNLLMGSSMFSFTETQAAADASIVVDGVSVTKSSNIVTDVIEGATLTLKGTGTGTITFETDSDDIKSSINNFVDSYNEVMSYIDEQFQYDSNNEDATSVLFGNTTLITIQNKLRGIVSNTIPGNSGTLRSLSSVGVSTDSNNELVVDDSKLSDAIRDDFSGVVNVFVSEGTTTSGNVTYLSKTKNTKGGTYEIRVLSGVVEIREEGTTSWTAMSGSGNYYTAVSNDEEGLLIRVNDLTDGSYGTVTVSTGAADQLSSEVDILLTDSYESLIYAEEKDAENNIIELQDQIDDLNYRIDLKEEALKQEFLSLEILMGKLKSEQEFLTQQFSVLT